MSLFPFRPNKRKKERKRKTRHVGGSSSGSKGIVFPPRILEHVRVLVPVSFRETRRPDRLTREMESAPTRDARRMYSTCRRCQTVKTLRDTPRRVVYSVLRRCHPNFSEEESSDEKIGPSQRVPSRPARPASSHPLQLCDSTSATATIREETLYTRLKFLRLSVAIYSYSIICNCLSLFNHFVFI